MHQLSLLTEANAPTPADPAPSSVDAKSNDTLTPQIGFDLVVGQTLAISLLKSAIAHRQIAPAYLFTGVDGIGKTLTARAFASSLLETKKLASHPDLLWVEPTYSHQGELLTQERLQEAGIKRKLPPQIRIEQVREITQFLSCSPSIASCKVVVVQDAESTNAAAANALLKTLEEPPGSNCLILLSSDAAKLLPTISSRCLIIPFRTLSPTDMTAILQSMGKSEVLKEPILMATAAGSLGKAIAIYNLYQSVPPELLAKLIEPPCCELEALQIAKEANALEIEQQLWLLDYLQYLWWTQYRDKQLANKVETAKRAMNKLAAPRLIWEVLLLPPSN